MIKFLLNYSLNINCTSEWNSALHTLYISFSQEKSFSQAHVLSRLTYMIFLNSQHFFQLILGTPKLDYISFHAEHNFLNEKRHKQYQKHRRL